MTVVPHTDGVSDVFLVRMDAVRADGEHEQYQRVVLTADATFTAREAEAFAVSILRAVRQLDAGLPGTPAGIPAVPRQAPEPWPPPGRNRALTQLPR